ncbi:MAG: hypothetical protein OHK0046_44550 [Anaerolineae bacterium]
MACAVSVLSISGLLTKPGATTNAHMAASSLASSRGRTDKSQLITDNSQLITNHSQQEQQTCKNS